MNDPGTRLNYLLRRYAEKQISEAERQELTVLLQKDWDEITPGQEVPGVDWHLMLQSIKAEGRQTMGYEGRQTMGSEGRQTTDPTSLEPMRPAGRVRTFWYQSAAAVFILIAVGLVFYRTKTQKAPVRPAPTADILPGGNKAILSLAGGQQIILDSAHQGDLTIQGNARITKDSDGKLSYSPMTTTAATQYNTLSTPRGGQYQLTLSDGTSVWLNAASSITYPTAFTGINRDVSITGEAYFEVKDKVNQPFRVIAGKDTIVDLGTHFNINAYADEPALRTTLLEGSVRILASGTSVVLKPGQQAVNKPAGPLAISNSADPGEAIAWKNGLFQFDRADIQTVMRQLARWYNVEVRFEGSVSPEKFWGKLPRDLNASQVLRVLQKEQVHFRIEGKTIIVTQ